MSRSIQSNRSHQNSRPALVHMLWSLVAGLLLFAVGAQAQPLVRPPYAVLTEGGITATVRTIPDAAPTDVAIFRVTPDDVPITLDAMRQVFYVEGLVNTALVPRNAKHCADGAQHVLFTPDGAGLYTDTSQDHLGSPIQPVVDLTLWGASHAILEDLGAFDSPYIELEPDGFVDELCDVPPCPGDPSEPIGRQTVIYRQRIDGLQTFGPGADVEIRFAGSDTAVGMTHAVRGLTPVRREATLTGIEAVQNWLKRIDLEQMWCKQYESLPTPEAVAVFSVELGYPLPEFGAKQKVILPSYRIQGLALYRDTAGGLQATPVVWHEPAVASAATELFEDTSATD